MERRLKAKTRSQEFSCANAKSNDLLDRLPLTRE
jgi:hypothetical protein